MSQKSSRVIGRSILRRAVIDTLESRRLLASVSGTIFSDANSNGLQDGSEGGLSGWTAYLDSNNNGSLDIGGGTVVSTDVPKSIPDNTTVTSNAISSVAGNVADINVTLNITHTWDSDLDIFLISPTGTRVELSTDNGGSGDNYTNTVFDDQATTSVVSGVAPFTGSYKPEGLLSTVNGQAAAGTWKLEVSDDTTTDTGTLLSWSIAITTSSEPSVITPASGAYSFTGLAAGNYVVRSVQQAGYAQTAPVGGAYPVTLAAADTVTGLNFGYAESGIFGNVYRDSNIDGTQQVAETGLANWAVYLDANNNGTLDGPVPFASTDVPKAVVDAGTVLSTNTVTGLSGTILDVNVTLTIAHTYDSDLDIYLVSPTGTRVELTTDNGSSSPNYTGTTFDDQATTSITAGVAPFSGTFKPEGLLSALNGQVPNGAWKLEVTDDTSSDTGTINSWSMTIATTASGTPETYVLTDANGNYSLKNLAAGNYNVRTQLQATYSQSQPAPGAPYNITLAANGRSSGNAFGVYQPPISVSGKIYNDANTNRIKDVGELPLSGFTVYIDSNNNGVFNAGEPTQISAGDGGYSFPNLQPGVYNVRTTAQSGWIQTSPGTGPIPQERNSSLAAGDTSSGTKTTKSVKTIPVKEKVDGTGHDLKYVGDEIVVSIATQARSATAANARRVLQGTTALKVNNATSSVLFNFPDRTVMLLKLNQGVNLESLLAELQRTAYVTYAQPNYIYNNGVDPREFTPNDPQYASQYHHTKMQNNLAWDTTLGSPDIIVAITDDGVSTSHVDLAANIWVNSDEIAGNGIDDDGNGYIDDRNGWDFSSNDNNPNPVGTDEHGTHVAGIVGARTNNGIGVAGTAGGATIMPDRFYGSGAWTSTVTTASYKYAADNGAKIISTSYNIDGFVGDNLFLDGVNYAYNAGLLHMNSAGNNSELNPARQAFEQLILVASSGSTDTLSSFSNYGYGVDVTAPGDNILSTVPTNAYDTLSGTSMATPNASGVAALIWSAHPAWTRDQVAAALVGLADNIDSINPTRAGLLGGGRVNSFKGVTQTVLAPKLKSTTLPAEGATLTTTISSFTIDVANVFSPASINNNANYSLRGNGADNVFGTSDDNIVPVTLATNYQIGTNRLTFNIGSGWVKDTYRFEAGTGLVDPFGQSIDGNANGTGGDSFIRTFNYDVPASPLTTSSTTTTADFGFYFAARSGTPGADGWYVRRSTDGSNIEIFENAPTSGPATFTLPVASVSDLSFNGNDGADTLTVDLANGNPVPTGGIEFVGGAGTNTLSVVGSAGNDTVGFANDIVTIGGKTISFADLASCTFSGGAGFDTLNLNEGSFTFASDVAATSDHLTISVATGASATLSATQHLEGLTLAAGSTATVAAGSNSAVVTKNLTIAGGTTPTATLDLADNDLIVDYTDPVGAKLTTIQAQINAGRGTSNGRYYAYSGFGIRSSSAGASNATAGWNKFAIGAINNADFAVATGAAKSTFSGETIDASSLLVSHTRNGDANLDGVISSADYTLINSGFAGTIANTGWLSGDFNGDGLINASDYSIIDFGNLFH